MHLELTDPSGQPILINTDWVAHWFPYEQDYTRAEMAHCWIDPNSQTGLPTVRWIVVMESYPEIRDAMKRHQKEPNAVVTVRPPRRKR